MTVPSGSVPETYDCFCGHPADEHALGGEQECVSCDCTDYEMEPVVADVSGSVPEPAERRPVGRPLAHPHRRDEPPRSTATPVRPREQWGDTVSDAPPVAEVTERVTTHVMADGTGLTACCGRTPFELPRTDRLAQLNVGQVNCTPPVPAPTEPKENTVSVQCDTCEEGSELCLTHGTYGAHRPMADPVPAPTVDPRACGEVGPNGGPCEKPGGHVAHLSRSPRTGGAESWWCDCEANTAELSVLRAREAQVRELAQEWDDAWEPCGESLLAVLDGTTGSGKTG